MLAWARDRDRRNTARTTPERVARRRREVEDRRREEDPRRGMQARVTAVCPKSWGGRPTSKTGFVIRRIQRCAKWLAAPELHCCRPAAPPALLALQAALARLAPPAPPALQAS